MIPSFPFTAITGQDSLLRALLVCAINPSIGGVLVRGDKGTAKSTAARALAALLPHIEKVDGCAFNCFPDSPLDGCDACNRSDRSTNWQSAPFVNLPLGATEDRVIGSLDIEKALKLGRRAFQPGLLASAHRGILYIDEVNLLPDHLVDSLLDAAASGLNTIEREGIAFSHPSHFALVGTMNLEEGDLRPQLLDRFALMVEVAAPSDPQTRAEIVRRRTAFDEDRRQFLERWHADQLETQCRIVEGRKLLPSVVLTDQQLVSISALCAQLQIRSLRADLVINKTARALAALDGRSAVTDEDIQQAAQLALPHRMRTRPGEQSSLNEEQLKELVRQFSNTSQSDDSGDQPESETENQSKDRNDDGGTDEFVLPSAPAAAVGRIAVENARSSLGTGRRSTVSSTTRGAYVRAVRPPNGVEGSLAVDATLRTSIIRNEGALNVESQDVHIKQRSAKTGNTILFVVDASGSMAALQRMSAVKGAVIGLLEDAYKCRDTVGVVAFRGERAQLVLPPTRSTDIALDKLESLPTGGRTPLASALDLAHEIARHPDCRVAPPLVVLLTDGKANVPSQSGNDAWADALSAAGRLSADGVACLVIDTEAGYILLGQARNLALAMGAEYVKLDELTSDNLKLQVKSRLTARRP